jgi:acyl-coenzyme A thioesterase PaaI-like protein
VRQTQRARTPDRYRDGDDRSVTSCQPYHTLSPVTSTAIARLADHRHGTGTAAAALYNAAKEADPNAEPNTRTLTASLHVDYLKPTPLGVELEVRGKVKHLSGRKVVVDEWILANGIITVKGEVIAVQVPESIVDEMLKNKSE